jgi:DNA (cytosine-5)-methyltransferase 1
MSARAMHSFYEFFAGGGMARAGLGPKWRCTFANDFDPMKSWTYAANWGHDLLCADVATVLASQLPGQADLAWASFPCQDLSLAGDYKGLGPRAAKARTRSGTFWPFWSLMRELARTGRAPRAIVLENVCGAITSNGGRDFAAIASALSGSGYRFGAMVVDAKLFVPQSRPRLFILAARRDLTIPAGLVRSEPSGQWHPPSLVAAHRKLSHEASGKWVWWNLPTPRVNTRKFSDLIEEVPTGVEWDSPEATLRLLGLMSPLNLAKVREAQRSGKRVVGGVYRRTRPDERGGKSQRAEVRFDDVSGCIRTPSGGSSRQRLLIVEGKSIRSRLLSTREAARLMGLPDGYKLPPKYNDAYHVAGDGVVVPVVRHLARFLIQPILQQQPMLAAAE